MDIKLISEIIKFKNKEGFGEKRGISLFRQILSALTYLHSNKIAHCDLKLENILIDRELKKTKLIDFGLSVQNRDKIEDFCVGTPCYMSPQLLKKENFNPFKADVWALGILLYKMIFGFLPYKGKSGDQILKKINTVGFSFPRTKRITKKTQEIISKMLEVKESNRPTAQELEELFKTGSA